MPGGLRGEILIRFIPDVAPITVADDPDGLLRDESLLAGLRERGFDVLFFEDPLAFRLAYESRFRASWDQDQTFNLIVARSDEETALPFDISAGARNVSLRLDDFFPNLSAAVIREFDPAARDRLFRLRGRAKKALGEDETRDFILRHLFHMAPETVSQPADLLRVLLQRHYRGERLSASVDDRLIRRLRRKQAFRKWPLQEIVSRPERFFAFLQERWPNFLDREAGGASPPGGAGDLALPGPVDLPFDHPDVRVYMDNLFLEGFLTPVEHPPAAALENQWLHVGVASDETSRARQRFERLLEIAQSQEPGEGADHQRWRRFARTWAELRSARLALAGPLPTPAEHAFRGLEAEVDENFARWLDRCYGALSNLPPISPVMLHHLPRALARHAASDPGARSALLVLDGLAFEQWVVLRQELQQQRPRLELREDAIFAWIPTITSVSRQAAFAGRPPLRFASGIRSTSGEEALWKRFWGTESLPPPAVAYARGLGEGSLDPVAARIQDHQVRVIGLVVDTVDKIMHGMQLGERGMQNQVRQWAQGGFLSRLLDLLLEHGFRIWLTSDHGNIEAEGCGRPAEGALADTRGERVRTYPDDVLRNQVSDQFPEARAWPPIGLPDGYAPLLAPGRKAFVQAGKRVVTHGGAAIEEVIVPLIRIGSKSS